MPPDRRAPVVEVAKVATDVSRAEVVAVEVDVAVLAETEAADLLEAPRLGAAILARLFGVSAAHHLLVARQADGGGDMGCVCDQIDVTTSSTCRTPPTQTPLFSLLLDSYHDYSARDSQSEIHFIFFT